jgi:hypothetical protein
MNVKFRLRLLLVQTAIKVEVCLLRFSLVFKGYTSNQPRITNLVSVPAHSDRQDVLWR